MPRSFEPVTTSQIFLYDEDSGLKIYPVAIKDVKVHAHRVEQGYSETVRVFVFPVTSPFLLLCLDRNEHHYHIPVSGPDPHTVGASVQSLIDSDDYAEDFLEHFIDQELQYRSPADLFQAFGVIPKGKFANDNPPLGKTVH